jgi:hypothetical protein
VNVDFVTSIAMLGIRTTLCTHPDEASAHRYAGDVAYARGEYAAALCHYAQCVYGSTHALSVWPADNAVDSRLYVCMADCTARLCRPTETALLHQMLTIEPGANLQQHYALVAKTYEQQGVSGDDDDRSLWPSCAWHLPTVEYVAGESAARASTSRRQFVQTILRVVACRIDWQRW